MHEQVDKKQENKSKADLQIHSGLKDRDQSTFHYAYNRREATSLGKLQELANKSPKVSQLKSFQDIANHTQSNQITQLQAFVDNSYSDQQPIKKNEDHPLNEVKRESSPVSEMDIIQCVKISEKGKPDETVKRSSIGFTKVFLGKHVAQNESEAKQKTINRQGYKWDPMGSKNTVAKPEDWLTALDKADELSVTNFKGTPQVHQTTSMPVWSIDVGERANRKEKDVVTSIDRDGNEVEKRGVDLSEEEWRVLGGAFISVFE
tara:strand:- start:30 stop:812 length:783 start_codon:yes stop_codon:yes gene_type:complete